MLFLLRDGYLRARWDRLTEGPAGRLAFEARAYLPTSPDERLAGLVGALRPIAKIGWELTPAFGFEIWESPIVPWYSQPGYETIEGPVMNRAFENRLELIPRLSLWSQ